MDIKLQELKRKLEDYLNSMSIEEFEANLEKCGIGKIKPYEEGDVRMIVIDRAFELLKKLHATATQLDYELCTVMNNDGKGTMGGDEYEKHMDVLTEVAEYLGVSE